MTFTTEAMVMRAAGVNPADRVFRFLAPHTGTPGVACWAMTAQALCRLLAAASPDLRRGAGSALAAKRRAGAGPGDLVPIDGGTGGAGQMTTRTVSGKIILTMPHD
ncbi:MAG TPA: hypothetical protein PKA03_03400 [Tabrizicola sp.]|nr:hypothetical protein [Tabrizicola sp.]